MPYIVQAYEPSGEPAASHTAADRKEALAVALRWADLGRVKIRIIGKGRLYTAEEMAAEIINEDGPSGSQSE
jgi:hypothetical protein